jgi:hypothetical protein
MIDYKIRPATAEEAVAVLEFWRGAAEGTSISDDPDGVRVLIERDPEALRTWSAAGYEREDHWRRWVKPLR